MGDGRTSREGGGPGRSRLRRWALVAAVVIAAVGAGLLLRRLRSDQASTSSPVSAGAETGLSGRADRAAVEALEGARSELSPQAELAMIDAAVEGQNVEETVDTGGEVSAALVAGESLVTAGKDGSVEVWGRSDGKPEGATQAGAPIELLAETEESSPYLAAVDRNGQVEMVDLTDPGRPRLLPLEARLAAGEKPLALAFAKEPSEIVAVGVGGEILRLDSNSGEVLSRSSLWQTRGNLPWRGGSRPRLVAARFVPAVYEDEEGLLVGTSDGAVADLDILRGQGKTVLAAGIAPGRILSLDRAPNTEPELAVGTTGGTVTLPEESDEPVASPGPAVGGVAIDFDEGLWVGGKEGVSSGESFGRSFSGPPVLRFEKGFDGIAAINPGGKVSILGPAGVGISMEETFVTPVSTFTPDGRLIVAEGFDATDIEELHEVRPSPRSTSGEYQEEDVVQTFKPGADWWPGAAGEESEYSEEEEGGLYLNDVADDGELLVAGGQDPQGDAAVMVWDAQTGKPLQHLRLGSGGVETELPRIVSKVLLLPGKHEIAAYSVTQDLLAIWSTDSWQLEASVPVGPASDVALSPDESTIVVVGLEEGDEESEAEYIEADQPTPLKFVDVDSGKLTDEVPTRGVTTAAFSPDGSMLALGDQNGYLRLRSADGRGPAGPLVSLHGAAEALAWRPDGKLIAAALSQGGVALVDPESGEVSEPLPPPEPYLPTLDLSWSADGKMLATLNPREEEGIEGYVPGPTAIWTLDEAVLEERMCELSACHSQDEPAQSGGEDFSGLSSVDMVFRREESLLAADLSGVTAELGRGKQFPVPPVAYDWSPHGFAWSTPGRVSFLLDGEKEARTWPCACSGVAWRGGEILALESSGKHLIAIDPRRDAVAVTPVGGLPRYSPALLGIVSGTPIVSAFESEPYRSTPSALFALKPDGTARKLTGDAHGTIYLRWPSSSPSTLVFGAALSGGACYSTTNVGVVRAGPAGRIHIDYPRSPLGGEETPSSLRSLQVAADGTVSAAIGGIGCNDEGEPQEKEPAAERYVLTAAGRWRPTGEKGYDVQSAGGTPLVEESEGFGHPGTLFAGTGADRQRLATEVKALVARP